MISIDYELSPEWNPEPPLVDPGLAGEAALRYEIFLGDIVFVVDGADLSARWGWVPVLDFALALRGAVRALQERRESFVDFTESDERILFERARDVVLVTATYAPGRALVSHAELCEAAERFLERVVSEICARYPRLAGNAALVALIA